MPSPVAVPRPRGTRRIHGDRLRALRAGKNWSQRDLAEAAGIQQKTISLLEQGTHTASHRRTIEALLAVFDTTLDHLAPMIPVDPSDVVVPEGCER